MRGNDMRSEKLRSIIEPLSFSEKAEMFFLIYDAATEHESGGYDLLRYFVWRLVDDYTQWLASTEGRNVQAFAKAQLPEMEWQTNVEVGKFTDLVEQVIEALSQGRLSEEPSLSRHDLEASNQSGPELIESTPVQVDSLAGALMDLSFTYQLVSPEDRTAVMTECQDRYEAIIHEVLAPFCASRLPNTTGVSSANDNNIALYTASILMLEDTRYFSKQQAISFEKVSRALAQDLKGDPRVKQTIAYARLVQYHVLLIDALSKNTDFAKLAREKEFLEAFLNSARHVNEAVEETVWIQFLMYCGRLGEAKEILLYSLNLRGSNPLLLRFSYLLALAEGRSDEAMIVRERLKQIANNSRLLAQVDLFASYTAIVPEKARSFVLQKMRELTVIVA